MAKKSNKNGRKAKVPAPKKKAVRKVGNASRAQTRGLSQPANPTFGAVSTINTAPVAIGNSLRGSTPQVLHTPQGALVVGRDFGFTVASTGTITEWVLAGGLPLTPACLPTTILRNFCNLYNRFKIRRLMVHYITSSPTSQAGDVMFYHNKDPNAPGIDFTSNSFLPFVLSDSRTIIGPQWTNHTIDLIPTQNWLFTDYGMQQSLSDSSAGDIFIYSKTSSANSPGYIILDYQVEFKDLSMTPRLTTVPSVQAQWQQFAAVLSEVVGNANVEVANSTSFSTTGLGATTISAPTISVGNVYKLQLCITNSTFTTPASANSVWSYVIGGTTSGGSVAGANDSNRSATASISPDDGWTCYAVAATTSAMEWFPTFEAAISGYGALAFQTVATYNCVVRGYMKWVGIQAGSGQQVAYN